MCLYIQENLRDNWQQFGYVKMVHQLSAFSKMEDSKISRHNSRQSGFTLIELLVVLVILGLLAGLVGPKVVSYLGRGKADTAKLQIEQLAAAMDLYLLDVGRYPAADEGIGALLHNDAGAKNWRGPYLRKDEIPLDPWGNEFHYEPPGESGNFELYSLGADNAQGGDGDNADISL